MEKGPGVVGGELEAGRGEKKETSEVGMGDHDAFRGAGEAGGIDERGQTMRGVGGRRGRRGRKGEEVGWREKEERCGAGGEAVAQVGKGE
jgi:hypothetical protein